MKLPLPVAWYSPTGNLYPSPMHAIANGEQAMTPLVDRAALLMAVADWLDTRPTLSASFAADCRMLADELRAASKEQA